MFKTNNPCVGLRARIKRVLFEACWYPNEDQVSRIIGHALLWKEISHLQSLNDEELLKHLEETYVERI